MTNPDPLTNFSQHLRCPRTQESLGLYTKDGQMYLVNQSQQYAYKVTGGIPVLLPTAALTWPELNTIGD